MRVAVVIMQVLLGPIVAHGADRMLVIRGMVADHRMHPSNQRRQHQAP